MQMYCLSSNTLSSICVFFDISYADYRIVHNKVMSLGGISHLWNIAMYNHCSVGDKLKASNLSLSDCACLDSQQFNQLCNLIADCCNRTWQDVRQNIFYFADAVITQPYDASHIKSDIILYQ